MNSHIEQDKNIVSLFLRASFILSLLLRTIGTILPCKLLNVGKPVESETCVRQIQKGHILYNSVWSS